MARFYIFGRNDEDVAERYAAAIREGRVGGDVRCCTPIWRRENPPPSPRWAMPEELTEDELEDAIHHLAAMIGRKPLSRSADSAALIGEIGAIKQELNSNGAENPPFVE